MTLEQALQIIQQAVANSHMTWQDHQMAQQAIKILWEAAQPKDVIKGGDQNDVGE